jgi:hypothetical protein
MTTDPTVTRVLETLDELTRDHLTRLDDRALLALRGNLAAWLALAELEDFERQQARSRRVNGCRIGLPAGEEVTP